MNELVKRFFVVTGTSPLLMHSPSGMKVASSKATVRVIPKPEEEAEFSAYRMNGKGSQLCGPAVGFVRGIQKASKGRRLRNVAAITVLKGAVFNTSSCEFCPLVDPRTSKPITKYEIDTRTAVIPKTGERIFRSRARVNAWRTEVEIEIDEDLISVDVVLEFFQLAGRIIGWLDFRPEKGGYFGRYSVILKV